jgi:hypothetical protein
VQKEIVNKPRVACKGQASVVSSISTQIINDVRDQSNIYHAGDIILPKKYLVVPKLLPLFLQYSIYSKPTQVVPITMVYQPGTKSDFPSPPPDSDIQATNMIIDKTQFTTVSNKKGKRSTESAANTIPSFSQQYPHPSPPVTVATATGTNHPEALPTK